MSNFKKSDFCQQVYDRRRACHLTQAQLAHIAGVSPDTVLKIEKGYMTPGVDKVCSIACALGCTPNDLLGWDGGDD